MLELAGALGQAPCKTCRNGVNEMFLPFKFHFISLKKQKQKEPILCKKTELEVRR